MSWKRIALYAVALNFIFFTRSCDRYGKVTLTSGFPANCQVVEIHENGVFVDIDAVSFSFPLLVLNLALCAALLYLIRRFLPRLSAFFSSTGFTIVAALLFVLFNSSLVPNIIWAYAVVLPTGYFYEFVTSSWSAGESSETPTILIDVVARLYFAASLAVVSLIPLAYQWIRRRMKASPTTNCLVDNSGLAN